MPQVTKVKTRKRLILACDTCRLKRTKCDGLRPSCNPCRVRGLDCFYQELPSGPTNTIESELATVNQRLDYITSLLANHPNPVQEPQEDVAALSSHEDSPFRLLATSSIMIVLDLEPEFPQNLIRLERINLLVGSTNRSDARLFFVPHQQAVTALVAFSERIHAYYPILVSNFADEYFRILSEPLTPSCQSCLVLLVAAVGCAAHDPTSDRENPYFTAALSSLPLVIAECSLVAVQCLIFLSIYYACLLKPCQAHDYCLVASFKIQNLFKSGLQGTDPDVLELTYRAYWAVLLLESELSIQLDVAKSVIWDLDNYVPLPNCLHTWQFPPSEELSTSPDSHSPASAHSARSTRPDQAQSFFLAEIAMRRMLHRCNSAVTLTPTGQSAYAPGVAIELERQLDEWYDYLPDGIRFPKDSSHHCANHVESLSNFLRVQYYCCKLSIYWPAIYQSMQDGVVEGQLLNHCQRFFDSYLQLMPSITFAFQDCLIHKWTLFLSIFITTMVVLKATKTFCLTNTSPDMLHECISLIATAGWGSETNSPSLKVMQQTLNQRLLEYRNQFNQPQ